jgi:GTPase SAR1 family protein
MPKIDNNVVNWYTKMPKTFLRKLPNPNYRRHHMEIPFRLLIVGSSGCGKTNLVYELIKRMSNTFDKIVICTKNKNELLYNFLSSKLKGDEISFYEGIESIPQPEAIHEDGNTTLVIFDDLCTAKDQRLIEDYFIRGRKLDFCMIYCTQSYYGCPKKVRGNINYIILKKITQTRDIRSILEDCPIGLDKKNLERVYMNCIKGSKTDFCMIDCDKMEIRKNFLEVVNIN